MVKDHKKLHKIRRDALSVYVDLACMVVKPKSLLKMVKDMLSVNFVHRTYHHFIYGEFLAGESGFAEFEQTLLLFA